MRYNLPDRVFRELTTLAQKYSVTKIILFGSRARGTHTERSDIDIVVYGGDFDNFYWDVKENIYSLLIFDIIQADAPISDTLKEEIKKEQEKVVHEPTGSYGMDTITMRQKIMERVMLMEENQLKEMLRFSHELEQKSWLLPHTQEELEIAINRGMEDVKAGRIVSHEDVLKYYMK